MKRGWILLAAWCLGGCGTESGSPHDGASGNRLEKAATGPNSEREAPDDPSPAAPVTGSPERVSSFTTLSAEDCRLVEENREEGSYWRRRCPGAGGYSVEWTESDLRQGLELVKGRSRTDVELSSIVAKGAFNRLGPRLEWRGKDAADPDSLMVRVFVANEDPSRPDRSLLAVAKLRPTPCVVAVIAPGPRQNEEARGIADGRPQNCMVAG